MAIDFEKIRTDNIREYGEGTRHLAFLGRLYPDRTHFIYELLQNAEDVKATSVKFSLHSDRLEFEHNGRLFNEADVRGICGVGEGTKTEDLTLIGKFGIGFKSVYAITNNPEVHSGNDHFRIEHYVRPYGCEDKTPAKGHETLFIFPFDRKDVEAPVAFDELHESLENMPTHTILFLKHVKKIYVTADDNEIMILSKRTAASHSNSISEIVLNNMNTHRDRYLLFSKPVDHPVKGLSVEIAYELTKKGNVAKSWDTDLVVFFPTEKKTNLGFIIQGPYRTTPARDNIPFKDDFNRLLIETTAHLMGDSLLWLRDNMYLDENIYDLLPIEEFDFPRGSMFRPFYEKLITALSDDDLILTSALDTKGSPVYCCSKKLAIARSAELRQLLDSNLLLELTDNQTRYWLSGAITEQTKPRFYKYLKDNLDIEEWRPEDLISKLNKPFLTNREDDWIVKLYKLILTQRQWFTNLNSQKAKPKWDIESKIPFFNKPIVRLQNGSQVKPFKSYTCQEPTAYLSKSNQADFPSVKSSILDDPEAKSFFELLGFTEPSDTEFLIEYILPKYENELMAQADLSYQIDTARQIIHAWEISNNEKKLLIKKKLENLLWLPAHSYSDENKYILSGHNVCYVPNDKISLFLAGSGDHYYICSELQDMKAALIEMGVKDCIHVACREEDDDGNVIILDERGSHLRGLDGFDPIARVDGLDYAIQATISDHNIDRAKFIWNEILIPNRHLISGKIEHSTKQSFKNPLNIEVKSKIGEAIELGPWLPNNQGHFYNISELSLAELPEGFSRDRRLAEVLGMEIPEDDPFDIFAREIGLPAEILRELKNNPDLVPDILSGIKKIIDKANKKPSKNQLDMNEHTDPEFPMFSIPDPERRERVVSNNIHEAPDKIFEKKERSVRTSGRSIDKETYLKNFYTNKNDEMICQLCKKIMPFRKRNGEYYFEAVEMLTKEMISKESESLYVALCPTCSAKYNEYIKQDRNKIHTMVKHIQCSEIEEIEIETDCPETLKFNPPHYLDVRTILTELIDQED
jgi:hypothetical protein